MQLPSREQIAAIKDPEKRREAEELVVEISRVIDLNPMAAISAYPKQKRFLASQEKWKVFYGGNGAGKTHIGVIDDLVQLLDEDWLPEWVRPFKRWKAPFYLRVVTPKFGISEEVILEKFRELCPKEALVGGGFDKAYRKDSRKLLFANGSHVLFNTADQDRDAHAGVRLHRVHFDEEPPGEKGKGIYHENLARLRDFQPDVQVMFTMTPLLGLSWTYDELYSRVEQHMQEPGVFLSAEDELFCVIASIRDNVFIDAEEQIRTLRNIPERERKAMIEGVYVHFHGVVLDRFDEQVHTVESPSREHVRGLETIIGIDPGVARGGVVWTGFDRDNHALVYDELYPSGMTVPEIAKAIKDKNEFWGLDDPMYVIDPSARNRVLTNAQSVEALFAAEDIFCVHGQQDRLAGVLQMKARVEQGALLVSRSCQNWLYESRRWIVAEDEESGKGASTGFRTKGPDHLMDPTRYSLMQRIYTPEHVVENDPADRWRPGHAPKAAYLKPRPMSAPMGVMS